MTAIRATGAPAVACPATRYRVTGPRVLRSEWAKFWSLRSSWITLGISLLLLVAVGIIAAVHYTPGAAASGNSHRLITVGTDAVAVALAGITLAQLAIGVLGVLVSGGEYSTGLIRSTLAAVPRRLPVLWSKTAVFAAVTLVVATAGAFAAFGIGEHFLAGQKIALTFSSAGVIRCLAGAGVYLALVAALGIALGALVRSVAGGIALLVVLLTLLPVLTGLLPGNWGNDVSPYLPGNAGDAIFALTHGSSALSPVIGLAVFAGWTAVALILAAIRLVRTDA
jgi:ABC-type transport system involved in multi-copper enzyme maturation permease subunit